MIKPKVRMQMLPDATKPSTERRYVLSGMLVAAQVHVLTARHTYATFVFHLEKPVVSQDIRLCDM